MKNQPQSEINMYKYNKGYIALLSVILAGAIGLTIALSLLWFGVESTQDSLEVIQSAQAKELANACEEIALKNIALSLVYIGTGSATIGQGTCTFGVVALTGVIDTVTATGTVGTVVRKVTANALLSAPRSNGFLGISGWQEIP